MAGASTLELRAADRTRLSVLNAQIQQLHVALNMLCSERQLVNDRLDAYTYPVLTLPNEIVSEIFIQYLPTYPSCPPLLGDGSPTKLGQICRRWRAIAHTTPALWRAVEIFLSEPSYDLSELQLFTTQTWLKRSTLPLSIVMGSEAFTRHRQTALGLLLAHRTRWEYVALSLPYGVGEDSNSALRRIEGSMPFLLELDLQFEAESHLDTLVGSLNVPRLHTAFLDFYHLLLPVQALPWSQLTKLFLNYIETPVAGTILRETVNLTHCRLVFGEDDHGSSDVGILRLPRLQTLIIGAAISSVNIYNLLLALRTAALRRLYIDAKIISPGAPGAEHLRLVSVINAFGCKLEKLGITTGSHSLQEFQTALPEVARIELVYGFKLLTEDWGHWNLVDLHGSGTHEGETDPEPL
ncbi:hypothetical protein C8F01DRAFT_1360749 [Mycena amicta]|nr:hypothetical protein C8F01DRAFT_1360749 [Mycena amicta]